MNIKKYEVKEAICDKVVATQIFNWGGDIESLLEAYKEIQIFEDAKIDLSIRE